MLRLGTLCGALACLLAGTPLRAADVALPPAAKTKIEFARDIEPLLAKRCLACHGAQQQMSGLRLDQKEAALKGGAAGVDILPGKSADSRLIRLVAGLDQKFMPPMGAHLTAEEVGLLRAWIDQGVEWTARAPHWSFQKIQRPAVPAVRDPRLGAERGGQLHPRAPRPREADALPRSSETDPAAPRQSRSYRPSPDSRTGPRRISPTTGPTLTNAWSIACSTRRTTARNGRATGSIWHATPIATATKKIAPAPGPGAIDIG